MSIETRIHAAEECIKLLNSKIENFDVSAFIDILHPVGEYYETSNEDFDPNVVWGGTWELEPEGYAHISGSKTGTYKVDGTTYGAKTVSYTPEGDVGSTKLSDANIAHGHGFTQPTISRGTNVGVTVKAHTITQPTFVMYATTVNRGSGSTGTRVGPYGETSGYSSIGAKRTTNVGLSDNHTVTVTQPTFSASGGAVSNLSGASSTRTAHDHSFTGTAKNINVMQESKAVYRWHRTA